MGEFRPNFPQFKDQGNGYLFDFLKREEGVVVLFFCPQNIEGQEEWDLIHAVERLAEKYGQKVRFNWLNSAEEAILERQMSIKHRPIVFLFQGNKEISRFICSSSEPGMCFEIEEALRPKTRRNEALDFMRSAIPTT